MHRSTRVAVFLLSLSALAGCRTWRPVQVSAPALVAAAPDVVRLVRSDGTRVTVSDPEIVADSIVGYDGFDPVRTALTDVRSAELQRWSGPRTAGFIVAQASLVLHIFALIVQVQPHYRGLF
jgi:hypothetical protein